MINTKSETIYIFVVLGIYTDADVKIGSYKYDAWGNVTSTTISGTTTLQKQIVRLYNPFRYRGYYYDTHSGLYYLQSRYYDPTTGRFINADGYINGNGDLIGYNMYAYCSNNPVMYTDPTGEFLGAAIGGIVGGIVGGLCAAIAGDNILAGVLVGATTGALSGLAVDVAVATGGIGAIVIAAVGGAIASGLNYSATELINGRTIDKGTLFVECSVGAVFNLIAFGAAGGGGTLANKAGNVFKRMANNACDTIWKNTTRKVGGEIVRKTAKGIAKNICKNIAYELGVTTVISGGGLYASKAIEYGWFQ